MEKIAGARVAYFDNLKFILITLVVLGHYLDPFSGIWSVFGRFYFFIYLFHMPLFMFVTGLFASSAIGYDRKLGKYANPANFGRPLAFLILYLILNFGIFAIEHWLGGKPVNFTPWEVSNASWYLLACAILTLAFCIIPNKILNRVGRNGKIFAVVILIIIALAAGYFPEVGDKFAASRVLCFAPFFAAGVFTRAGKLAEIIHRRKTVLLKIIACVALIGCLLFVIFMPEKMLKLRGILTARNTYEYLGALEYAGAAFRLCWYIASVVLGCCVLLLTPASKNLISRLGENSIGVYIWHIWLLRLLGAAALVPAIAQVNAATGFAIILPLLIALASAVIFSLKPPFGIIASKILEIKIRF
jgi:fucose 4-O-acetylase-like acetyltransferase